jgi:hypothetical protein
MSLIRTALIGSVALALVACTIESSPADSPPSSSSSSSGGSSGSSGVLPQGACVRDRDVTASETWSTAACPDGYLVKKDIAVKGAGVELKIEPGTVVKFDADAGLQVEESAALIAEGTADKKIRFTGYQEASGTWRGLVFASNNVKNKIAFAKIDSAGSGNARDRDAALHLGVDHQQAARLALTDTEISGNRRFGLTLQPDASLSAFERVTIKDNVAGAAHVYPPSVAQLKGTSLVLESNGPDNLVMIETNIGVGLIEDAVWPSVSPATYRVVGQHLGGGNTIYVKRHLTIEPGAVFELAGGSGILVEGGSAGLKAVGTADKKIIFKGVTDSSWKGITFGETTWTENRLENVEIKNAADAPEFQYYGTGAVSGKTAILMGYNGATPVHLTINNVSISGPNNAPYDVTKKPACN